MDNAENFVLLKDVEVEEKSGDKENGFTLNEISIRRRKKERPENQIEPEINEIQRFGKREP